MKTIIELINDKTANFDALLKQRQTLLEQIQSLDTTLLELQGHISGLKSAATLLQDEEVESQED